LINKIGLSKICRTSIRGIGEGRAIGKLSKGRNEKGADGINSAYIKIKQRRKGEEPKRSQGQVH